jgi:hypothetical protein
MTLEQIIQADKEGYRFTVDGWRGIAFYLLEPETVDEWDEETGENVTEWSGYKVPTGNVVMVMVGDDREHVIDPDDVNALDDDEYCPECGQVGCTAYKLAEWNA